MSPPTPAASAAALYMESCVAALAAQTLDADRLQPVGPAIEVTPDSVPLNAKQVSLDTWVVGAANLDSSSIHAALAAMSESGEGLPREMYRELFHALRADSSGAPASHSDVIALGEPWISAELCELGNHAKNSSWTKIKACDVPRGRRVHRLVWVYKLKRDGSAKARLCVQGCTMQHGIDYDQVFSQTLRYSSARSLFAFAAAKRCFVRSIDYVAAYLQGKFEEGEVVYTRMPDGHVEYDENGDLTCVASTSPSTAFLRQAADCSDQCSLGCATSPGCARLTTLMAACGCLLAT